MPTGSLSRDPGGGVKVDWSLSCMVPTLQARPWMPVPSPEARGMPGLSPAGSGQTTGLGRWLRLGRGLAVAAGEWGVCSLVPQ